MLCALAGSRLTTREAMAELRLGVRQLYKRRRELGLVWRTEAWGGRRRISLYDPATVGRAAAYLAAERAQRPWDSRRICVARETRKLRRELATLAWEYARAALRVELMRVGCDCPLKEIPRQRLELVREVVKAAVRRMP